MRLVPFKKGWVFPGMIWTKGTFHYHRLTGTVLVLNIVFLSWSFHLIRMTANRMISFAKNFTTLVNHSKYTFNWNLVSMLVHRRFKFGMRWMQWPWVTVCNGLAGSDGSDWSTGWRSTESMRPWCQSDTNLFSVKCCAISTLLILIGYLVKREHLSMNPEINRF